MKHNIHYSAAALQDLDDIWSYVARELQNVSAAERLADYPEMGPVLSSIADVREEGYRFLVTGSYIAFYRVADGGVYVDRVLYGRRDYLALLFGGNLSPDT